MPNMKVGSHARAPYAQVIQVDVNRESVGRLLEQVAWPEQHHVEHGDEPAWAFVFNGHNGTGDSMLVLRESGVNSGWVGCNVAERNAEEVGNPSLLVIHLRSKKRVGAKEQATSWAGIQEEASKIGLYADGIHCASGRTASVRQIMLYVTDERCPVRKGKRRAEDLERQLPQCRGGGGAGSSAHMPPMGHVEPGSELLVLERGEAVKAANGLWVCAVFQGTQWRLRGASQVLKYLLGKSV